MEESVAIVSINNPPVNVLSKKVFEEIYLAIDAYSTGKELVDGKAAKCIILTGEGPNFAAGADVKEIHQVTDPSIGEKMSLESHKVAHAIEYSPIPVIAAVNGYCLGGGCEVAMSCHMRIATDKARFGQPEINIGIIPGMGGTQRLPRYVGKPKAIEMLLVGDPISSQEAKALGLVNTVVPETELLRYSKGLAKKIAQKSRVAIKEILDVVRDGLQTNLEGGLKCEAAAFGRMMATKDKAEGIAAFLEKRQPKFS